MTGDCACGAVKVTITARPDFINDCDCGLCRKVGGAWGYFPSAAVTATGDTISFVRQDKENAAVEIHACKVCATTTHWVLTKSFREQNKSVDQMGVNMRIFDPDDLTGIEVRFPNGRDWDGQGDYGYRRESMTISETTRW